MHPQRIPDRLRPLDRPQHLRHPRRLAHQQIQIVAEQPHRDRRLDRRPVLELLHHDPRARNRRHLASQPLEHRRTRFRIVVTQRREDLRHVRLRRLRHFVVVDLGILVPHRRHRAQHLRVLRQQCLHLSRHRIRGRDTRPFFRLDLHQKLRQPRLRKQRETDPRHQRQTRPHQHQRADQGQRTMLHARMQQRPVTPLDPTLQPLQQPVPLRRRLPAQHQARQQRDDRQRYAERRHHREHHRERQTADVFARPAGQQHQRQKREHQRRRRPQDRDRDLLRALDRRLARSMSLPSEARDVFHHHDRIVHQQPERDHAPDNAQLVQAVARVVKPRDADRQRERNRHQHQQRRAKSQRQHRHEHEREREKKIRLQPPEPVLHVQRLIPADLETDVARQRRPDLFDLRPQPLAQLEQILRRSWPHGYKHRALAVVAPEILLVCRRPLHRRDVLHPHDRGPAARDRRPPQFLQRRITPARLQVEPPLAHLHRAAGNRRVVALDRRDDLADRQPLLRHLFEVQRHPHLLLGKRMFAHLPRARHRLEPLAQRLRQFLQSRVTRVRRHQRDLHHRHVRRLEFSHVHLDHPFRQSRPFHVHLPQHLVVFLVRIRAIQEIDRHQHEAVLHRRPQLVDVVELLDRIFQRSRHQLLDVRRIRPRINRHDRERRNLQLRVLHPRNRQKCRYADRRQTQEHDQRELRVPHRVIDEPLHGTISTAAPSCRYSPPCTTTRASRGSGVRRYASVSVNVSHSTTTRRATVAPRSTR